jgi:hypothetical protein
VNRIYQITINLTALVLLKEGMSNIRERKYILKLPKSALCMAFS